MKLDVDALAQEIRRVDGNNSLGAGALAEALMPFLTALGEQKPVAWTPADLVPGRAYESRHFGLVTYVGVDTFYGQATHKFRTPRGSRYALPDKLAEFLAPRASPQPVAVSEEIAEGLRAARWLCENINEFGQCIDNEGFDHADWAIRRAFEALAAEPAIRALSEERT